jgi:hypothetical protein
MTHAAMEGDMRTQRTTTSDPRQAALLGSEPDAPHGARKNQRQQILDKLIAAGTWVSALELAAISLQYSARVRELRLDGYAIENRVKIAGGRKVGEFRLRSWVTVENGALVSTPARTASPAQRTGEREDETPMLFPRDAMQSRHRDDG